MAKISALLEWIEKKQKNILIILAIFFWVAAIGYSIYLDDRLPYPDESWYFNDYAQTLANRGIFSRDGVNPTAFHPPAYPLALGGLVSMGLGITAARLMNFFAFFITLGAVFCLLKKQGYKIAPILAIFMALAYPVLFYTAGTLYPQTFGAVFFVLAVMFYWHQPLKIKNAIFSGIAMGIGVLTIPTFIFVPVLMVFFSLIFQKKTAKYTILLFAITLLILTLWITRNYLTFERFIPFSTNSGLNFLIGNNPSTTPNSGVNVELGAVYEEVGSQGLDEFEENQFYTQKALIFIQEDPAHYMQLYILKVLNYFNYSNELATSSEASQVKDLLMLASYGSLILLALIRLSLFRAYPITKLEIFLFILYLSSAFASALFFTRIRFRLPFDYLLIILIAIFLERVVSKKTDEFSQ